MGDMDNFAKKFLENAQIRSKKLGISNMPPLKEHTANATPSRQCSMKSKKAAPSPKRRISTDRKVAPSPNKSRTVALRTNHSVTESTNKTVHNIEAKENVDLALEINITTGPNMQVQVEYEEQDIDADGKVLNTIQKHRKKITAAEEDNNAAPSACIPDSSRNQLHRLGAMYSNPQEMSSPVHRTETAFNIEDGDSRTGPKIKKSHRLAELTSTINAWEDESKVRANILDADSPSTSRANDSKTTAGAKTFGRSPRKVADNKSNSVLNRIESIEKRETDDNKNSNNTNKQMKWDKSIMESLESQGYKRRDTTTKRLEYDFSEQTDGVSNAAVSSLKPPKGAVSKGAISKSTAQPEPVAKKVEFTKGLVSGRAAIFETGASRSGTGAAPRNQKDPAEMSLQERMALFEKNKGEALIPKSALGMAPSAKQIMADKKITENVKQVITTPQQPMIGSTVSASNYTNNTITTTSSKINNFNKVPKADTMAGGSGIRQAVAALLAAPSTIAEARIANENRKIREQEMNVVLNRFNLRAEDRETPPPPAPPMPENLFTSAPSTPDVAYNSSGRKRLSDEHLGVSAKVRKSLENVKQVRVNPPKSGQVYPALSDIESSGAERNTPENYTPEPAYTDDDNEQPIMDRYMYSSQEEDSYMDSDDEISNLGRDNERRVHYADSSITSSNTESSEMEKYLDEAMDNEDDDDNRPRAKTLQKGSVSSNSFSYERKPLNRQHETIFEEESSYQPVSKFQSPIKSRLTVNPSEDNNSVTLTHTVSFYRRQQVQNSPAVRKVVQAQVAPDLTTDDNTDFEDDDRNGHSNKFVQSQEDLVEKKIKSLMDTVMIQNQQIAQASNALTTCASTFEFSGSTESVVAEWKLLVATHSRKAALQEVQRLQVDRCLRPADAPKECGRLTIKDIVLPLRDDYVKKVSEDKIPGHHLVCLLKYNEHVLATKTIPTLPGLLAVKFPGELHLDNVYADFKITLEIYGMIAQRESLPHEIKYHIRKEKKGVMKTPKGKKAGSNLIMPPAQSPAGPNVVRAPAFAYYGFIIFSLREVQRNTWTLNQVAAPDITPLIGTVHMKINCALSVNIDHKAFLTMFEDVSGFGAWHRRWCRLHGNILSYWKYPDDERTKPPIGSLDLGISEQQKISTAPREMCARLNTLMIELKRSRQDDDEDSMLLQTQGNYSYVRHLLSADTKEERDEWCAYFNKTLALMRAWGNSDRSSK